MNNEYLEKARKVIRDPRVLTIVAAKRARQLAYGSRPLVNCTEKEAENHVDVALREIMEGKIVGTNIPDHIRR